MQEHELFDPFHRELRKRLDEEVTERALRLASGSAFAHENSSRPTAEHYAEAVGYLNAIRDVLELAKEIEQNRYAGERARASE